MDKIKEQVKQIIYDTVLVGNYQGEIHLHGVNEAADQIHALYLQKVNKDILEALKAELEGENG